MTAMPLIDYAAVRARIPMLRVLTLLDFQPTHRRGDQLRGRCPLPQCPSTSRRSFSVNVGRHVYRCFACRSQGNQLDLWSAARQLPLPQAALDLCRSTNTPVPQRLTRSKLRNSHQPTPRPATG
jgi:DNA primase